MRSSPARMNERRQTMPRTHAITLAALTLAVAALPALARAEGEGGGHPQEEARIQQMIEQAIQGNSEADRQEQARIERLVQQALQRAALPGGEGGNGRADILAQGRPEGRPEGRPGGHPEGRP